MQVDLPDLFNLLRWAHRAVIAAPTHAQLVKALAAFDTDGSSTLPVDKTKAIIQHFGGVDFPGVRATLRRRWHTLSRALAPLLARAPARRSIAPAAHDGSALHATRRILLTTLRAVPARPCAFVCVARARGTQLKAAMSEARVVDKEAVREKVARKPRLNYHTLVERFFAEHRRRAEASDAGATTRAAEGKENAKGGGLFAWFGGEKRPPPKPTPVIRPLAASQPANRPEPKPRLGPPKPEPTPETAPVTQML
jgi:hypothetical protein